MPYIETKDGTRLFYKDWGDGQTVVFVPGWCLSSEMWEYQMVPLSEAGFRCISYDVRGCGRSDQPGGGYDLDTLADDLAAVIEGLGVRDAALVGHSAGRAPRSSAISPATARLGSPGSHS
jgi:non-heme chloroperoxidase